MSGLVLTTLLLGACSDSGWGSTRGDEATDPGATQPNVLLIVLDTTRADRCGFNGYERATTPGLDRLAQEGVTFTRAWSPSPWTPPAHASLFSGLRPENHGLQIGDRDHLTPDADLLAERLSRAGYATGAFINNPAVNPDSGLLQGFDSTGLLYEEEQRAYPWATSTHERALAWIDDQRAAGKPFFAFLNHMEPHGPYTPPATERRRFLQTDASAQELARAASLYGPDCVGTNRGRLPLGDAFRGLLSEFAQLRQRGVLDDTLVIVTADHGENLGDHGLVDHMFSVHKSLLHVPLIVRYPDRFHGGAHVDDLVRSEDVLPTILEVCGLSADGPLDGRSLLRPTKGRLARAVLGRPLHLLDVARRRCPQSVVEGVDRSLRSVFDGRLHLIQGSDGWVQLFDVVNDPAENQDLSKSRPDEVRRLRALLPE